MRLFNSLLKKENKEFIGLNRIAQKHTKPTNGTRRNY